MKILDIPQSGKRGLTVSQNGRYGQISRAYVMPANPHTASQMAVRATFGTVASAWDGLTEAQRQAWIAAASTRQTKTRCGTSGPMTGLQFFVQINANLLAMGQEQVTAPPATPRQAHKIREEDPGRWAAETDRPAPAGAQPRLW